MNVKVEKLDAEELDAPGIPVAARQPETANAIGALLDDADAEDLDSVDDLDNGGEVTFIPVSVTKSDGSKKRVYVKELDVLDVFDVEAGRLLVRNQKVIRAPAREGKMGLALEFVACVHKRTRDGEYIPLWNDTQEAQRWMKRANNKPLVGQIITAIYVLNPELNPLKKMEAEKRLNLS